MKHKLIKARFMKRLVLAVTALILIASSFSATATLAAKQSVNVNPSVLFTLDNVSLTSNSDSQTMSFTLNLSNQSGENVDLNQYGVRVMDKDGNVFSAQLAEKASARVLPHQSQSYKYSAEVPGNISLNQLSVNVFAWDYSAASFMRNLGSMDAAPAAAVKPADSSKQIVLDLSDLDPALSSGTKASFELLRSYKVLQGGVWSVYSDVRVENLSTQAIQLPANLLFNLRDDNKLYIPASVTSGANPTLQPNQRTLITFQAILKSPDTSHKLTFELAKRPVLGVKANNLLGALSIDDSLVTAQVGSIINYPTKAANALKMLASRATYSYNTFGNEIAVDFTLSNDGKTVVSVPAISGAYQVTNSTLTIGASEAESHPDTLGPGQSTAYHFTAYFPKSTDESAIQLVIMENLGSISTPVNLITLPSSISQTGEGGITEATAVDLNNFDAALSKYSMLSLQVIRSYHSVSNGSPTVNIDVAAANETASEMKLPASLLFTVQDSDHLSYSAAMLSGADQSIMPHQSIQFTLQAATGIKDTSSEYTLQIVKKADAVAASSTGASAATAANASTTAATTSTATAAASTSATQNVVYDTLDLTSSFANKQVNGPLNTAIGKLGVTLKSTYRLATGSGDDILMSEVEIQNLDSKTVTLPNQAGAGLYGGYMIDELDAQGKVIRIQSSAFLYPNQKTTVYIYTKIPYTSSATAGYIYLGDGTLNAQTSVWTQMHEWAELPYALNTAALSTVGLNSEWMVGDTGRTSTGKVVDSQVYDINNQKMLAVRILQTNKESRNGSIVPYTGYITNADGTTLALKTTDDSAATTKLSKEGTALSTLWTVLPSGFTTDNQQFIFGQKIDDAAFASPLQYDFAPSTAAANGSVVNASLFPYSLSVQNAKLAFTTTGAGANAVSGYDITFDYAVSKTLDAAGIVKNRSLEYKLADSNGKVVKTWDTALDGVDAWTTGVNKLSFLNADIPDLSTFISYAKTLSVYEKFEGGIRLIGTVSVTF